MEKILFPCTIEETAYIKRNLSKERTNEPNTNNEEGNIH